MALYHSARGSVGYTIVGSPTIVDGVVSNFNASNYLKFNSQTFSPGSGPFEIQLDYTTGNSATSYGYSLYLPCININQPGGVGNFRINITTTTETFYLRTERLANTKYVLKVTYDGNGLYSLYSNGVLVDSRSSTQLNTTSAGFDYTIGIREDSVGAKIDLKNTYITVNGQPWFGICPIEVKKHQLMGPVGYTVVGSPTITDGVASRFSGSNYLQISQTYNATNDKNVEIYVRAKTPTTISSSFNPIFGADNIGFWGISSYTNALFTIRMGYSNGTTLTFGDMYISGGIQADTWYRFKITGSNGIWRAEIYNDSETLLNSADRDWTSNTLNENYTIKLKCTDNTNAYSGSIDLNNTYIKVNGKLWYWQPRETEKIVVNGVQVWQKSS